MTGNLTKYSHISTPPFSISLSHLFLEDEDKYKAIFNVAYLKNNIKRISFYSNNRDLLLPKPKHTFRHLKQGIQQFYENSVLVPADKAGNNAIFV